MAAACGGLEGATWQEAQESWHRDGGHSPAGAVAKAHHASPAEPAALTCELRRPDLERPREKWKAMGKARELQE